MVRITSSPQETTGLGRLVGHLAYPGLVILVQGDLGTGKTCFAQGVGAGLQVRERVKSPSFALANEYHGRLPMYHLDLYRLEHEEELLDVGLSEYLYSDGVTLIEWAERAREWFPSEHLYVVIEALDDQPQDRRFMLSGQGQKAHQLLARLEEKMS